MQITDVKISEHRLSGIVYKATITFDNVFVVRGFQIIDCGDKGILVCMPEENCKDIAYPINSEFERMLIERIIEEYKRYSSLEKNIDTTIA